MKSKHIIPIGIACLLLTGCANGSKKNTYQNIQFEDMFQPKSDKNTSSSSMTSNTNTDLTDPQDDDRTESAPTDRTKNVETFGNQTVYNKNNAANQINPQEESNKDSNDNTPEIQQNNSESLPENEKSKENTPPSGGTIGNHSSSSFIYTNDQQVAEIPLGDICYFPYKTASAADKAKPHAIQPKESSVSTDKDTLNFTPGISQSATEAVNELKDDRIKEIKDVVENISVIADKDAGLNTAKLYATPDATIQQSFSDISMSFDLMFKDASEKDIQPKTPITVKIPVPSELKSQREVYVYYIEENGTPKKIEAQTQTDNEIKYMVFNTDALGKFILTEIERPISGHTIENHPQEKKYDHGYKVVFRTNTDTYLLGVFPYDQCMWDEVNDMCAKIADMFETDCQMVGAPSLEDLKYFTDRGIYLPGKYEIWTSTSASPNSAYYRNSKGAFYSTKSTSQKCGVCAIIRISAPQNNSDLLSSSLLDYEETKSRLEAEEKQYALSISKN